MVTELHHQSPFKLSSGLSSKSRREKPALLKRIMDPAINRCVDEANRPGVASGAVERQFGLREAKGMPDDDMDVQIGKRVTSEGKNE